MEEKNQQISEEQYLKQLNDQQINRRNKLSTYKELNINPFGQAYDTNSNCLELKKKYKKLKKEEVDESSDIKIAGRIVLLRKMGKASFFTLQDRSEKIQVYIKI